MPTRRPRRSRSPRLTARPRSSASSTAAPGSRARRRRRSPVSSTASTPSRCARSIPSGTPSPRRRPTRGRSTPPARQPRYSSSRRRRTRRPRRSRSSVSPARRSSASSTAVPGRPATRRSPRSSPTARTTLKVRQTDEAGNVSDVAERTWILDRAAPEAPTVLSGPTGTVTDRGATFEFATEPDATLECRVDGGAWGPCTSPLRLDGLGLGNHTLELRATDAAGNVSAVRKETWTIAAKPEPSPAPAPAPAKTEGRRPRRSRSRAASCWIRRSRRSAAR